MELRLGVRSNRDSDISPLRALLVTDLSWMHVHIRGRNSPLGLKFTLKFVTLHGKPHNSRVHYLAVTHFAGLDDPLLISYYR